MKTKHALPGLISGLLLLAAISTPAQAALIQNGDFEAGFTNWSSSGNLEWQTNYPFFAGDQTGIAVFNAANLPGNGLLSQSFTTIPLQVYTVTMQYGSGGSADQRLLVDVLDGVSSDQLINTGSGIITQSDTGSSVTNLTNQVRLADAIGNEQLATYQFTFTAESTSSILRFTDALREPLGTENP